MWRGPSGPRKLPKNPPFPIKTKGLLLVLTGKDRFQLLSAGRMARATFITTASGGLVSRQKLASRKDLVRAGAGGVSSLFSRFEASNSCLRTYKRELRGKPLTERERLIKN